MDAEQRKQEETKQRLQTLAKQREQHEEQMKLLNYVTTKI